MNKELSQKIEKMFGALVGIRSDTGTPSEKDIEDYLFYWLGKLEYFSQNSNLYGRHKLPSDPLERSVIWGLVRGNGSKTVIFIHHHDVVDSRDYGPLSDCSNRPEKLQKAMEDLDLSDDVMRDLESGEWIFGRGTADMKAGAAIQLALLEEYSTRFNFKGNLLVLSLPDGESLSAGMRSSLKLLKDLKKYLILNIRWLSIQSLITGKKIKKEFYTKGQPEN